MGGEWVETPLGELVDIFDGPHATPVKTDDGPIFLGISNLDRGRLDLTQAEHISEHDYSRWTRRVTPRANDVVFSYETRLGEAALVPPGLRCCLGRRMGLLRAKPRKVDPRFLLFAYLGPAFQETIRARTIRGSTVDRIPLIEMGTFPIRVPTLLDEQRAIAHILGTLDDKIELNRRMSETLEAMARALFKAWFVDFDPVRAKAKRRDPGLPKHLADLFPDSFEDSELGEIPRGWAIADIYQASDVVYGAPFKSEFFNDHRSGRPLIRIRDLASHDPQIFTPEKQPRGHLTRPGDLIVGMDGEFRAHLWRGPEAWLNQRLCSFLPRSRVPRAFVHYSIERLLDFFERSKSGTTVIHLGKADIDTFRIVLPPAQILAAFGAAAGPMDRRVVVAAAERRRLVGLRDTLLPKLISGEVRVPAAHDTHMRGA